MPIHAINCQAQVLSNELIIENHRVIKCVAPEIARMARPGHFVNILVSDGYDPLLRKPFSIYTVDREKGEISVLFSIVGAITRGMSRKKPGDTLDIFGPLGGSLFEADPSENVKHIMVGGGYGVPPLVFLSNELRLINPKADITFLIGARKKELLLCEAELIAAGVEARSTTEDGSHGIHGRVTDALEPIISDPANGPMAVYCCGPTSMMAAVSKLAKRYNVPCQVSVEVRMPCGVGVCMGCVIDLADGKRVRCCTDGPVFNANEVVW